MRFDFYAYMDRMKYIKRWQLMRSTREENIMEHSHGVTVLSHALAVIRKEVFKKDVEVEKVVLYAVYHETSEVMTGDLPTPIKYYNQGIHGAYKDLEKKACEKMVSMLPEEMQTPANASFFASYFFVLLVTPIKAITTSSTKTATMEIHLMTSVACSLTDNKE